MSSSVPTKSKTVDPMEITGITFRYGILFILYVIIMLNIYKQNVQFIMFILLLILLVFFTTFVLSDMLATTSIFAETLPFKNFYTINSSLTSLFIFGISVTVLFKIISLTLFIVTLNYGRKQLKNSNNVSNSKFTSDNEITFNNYINSFISSTILLVILLSFIFILHSSYEVRVSIINIGSLLLTLSVLGLSSYEMYYSSRFFDIFKTRGIVYQV
jgi:hypothetical protein